LYELVLSGRFLVTSIKKTLQVICIAIEIQTSYVLVMIYFGGKRRWSVVVLLTVPRGHGEGKEQETGGGG
jgi:hypothetical protein